MKDKIVGVGSVCASPATQRLDELVTSDKLRMVRSLWISSRTLERFVTIKYSEPVEPAGLWALVFMLEATVGLVSRGVGNILSVPNIWFFDKFLASDAQQTGRPCLKIDPSSRKRKIEADRPSHNDATRSTYRIGKGYAL